jgi:hypothetical protein
MGRERATRTGRYGMKDVWTYRTETLSDTTVDMTGFDVEALDGSIGKIDEASHEAGSSYVVVDTGFWIFGKKRMIPAHAIDRLDLEDQKVWVNLTKEQIKDAPDFDERRHHEDDYREHVGEYYGRF